MHAGGADTIKFGPFFLFRIHKCFKSSKVQGSYTELLLKHTLWKLTIREKVTACLCSSPVGGALCSLCLWGQKQFRFIIKASVPLFRSVARPWCISASFHLIKWPEPSLVFLWLYWVLSYLEVISCLLFRRGRLFVGRRRTISATIERER